MHIANFTPDEVLITHMGVPRKLMPDEVMEVDQNRGNHILNKWGERGLIQLQYGDDEGDPKLKEMAMEIYTTFWTKQIGNYNQFNERMRNESKPFQPPTRSLKEHADKLGVQLLSPWIVEPKKDTKEIKALEEENAANKAEIAELKDLMNQVITSQAMQPVEQAPEDPMKKYTNQFASRGAKKLKVWARLNQADISEWPPEAIMELQIVWEATYGKDPESEDEIFPF